MWNKRSLRTRITILGGLCLSLACALLAGLQLYNTRNILVIPLTEMILAAPAIDMEAPPEAASGLRAVEAPAIMGTIEITPAAFLRSAEQSSMMLSLLGLVAVAVLGTLAIWLLTGRMLRPVKTLSEHMAHITVPSLSEQVAVPESHDEVASLATSLNRMIRQVHTAYEIQRRFAQSAAHELKTPLSTMLTTLEVAEMEPNPTMDTLTATQASLKESTLRMIDLVKDMLLLNPSLPEAEMTTFPFSTLYHEIQAHLTPLCVERRVAMTLEGDCVLRGSRPLLARAFENILHNAVQYNAAGGEVFVIAKAHVVSVRDTGPGIPEAMREKVFEPFFRGDPSRARTLGGTGLGLSIAKQILDLHGMDIRLEGTEGTTVRVEFE